MIAIRVVAPNGATLRGPMKVRLSDKQVARRAAILEQFKTRTKGVYEIDGDVALNFKRGEVFEIEDGAERLHKDLFEDVEKVESEAKARKAAAEEAARNAAEGAAAKKAAEDEAARKAAEEAAAAAQSRGTA